MKEYTTKEIAELVGGRIVSYTPDEAEEKLRVHGVKGYEEAGRGEITFAVDRRHLEKALAGEASVILAHKALWMSLSRRERCVRAGVF